MPEILDPARSGLLFTITFVAAIAIVAWCAWRHRESAAPTDQLDLIDQLASEVHAAREHSKIRQLVVSPATRDQLVEMYGADHDPGSMHVAAQPHSWHVHTAGGHLIALFGTEVKVSSLVEDGEMFVVYDPPPHHSRIHWIEDT